MKLKDILRNRLVIVGIFIGLAMVNLVFTTVAFIKGDVLTGLAFGLFTLNLLCGAFKYLKWEEDIRELHQHLEEVYDFVNKVFNKDESKKPHVEVCKIGISEETAQKLSSILERIRKNAEEQRKRMEELHKAQGEQPAEEAPAASQDAADHTDADLTHEEAVKMNLIDNEAGSGDGC